MHSWGDGFKFFADVDTAAYEIGELCKRYGRINVTTTKEKYGTARVYCSFGYYSLDLLLSPGYVFSRWPKWLRMVDYKVFVPILQCRPVSVCLFWWQRHIYRWAYARTIKKFPHIRAEILDGADYDEYLKGL